MAGNPNCPVKLEKRLEMNQRLKGNIISTVKTSSQHPRANAWTSNTNHHLFGNPTIPLNTQSTDNNSITSGNDQASIINILAKISSTMMEIKQQQDALASKIDSIDSKAKAYHSELEQIKHCVYDILCPLITETAKQTHPKSKNAGKTALLPLQNKLVQFLSKITPLRDVDCALDNQPNIQEANVSINITNQPDNYEP